MGKTGTDCGDQTQGVCRQVHWPACLDATSPFYSFLFGCLPQLFPNPSWSLPLWPFLETSHNLLQTTRRCCTWHPTRSPAPLWAATPSVCRVIQRDSLTDPPGGWHFGTPRVTAPCDVLGTSRDRDPLALLRVFGFIHVSFSAPLCVVKKHVIM